jgi:hypothetical protein
MHTKYQTATTNIIKDWLLGYLMIVSTTWAIKYQSSKVIMQVTGTACM